MSLQNIFLSLVAITSFFGEEFYTELKQQRDGKSFLEATEKTLNRPIPVNLVCNVCVCAALDTIVALDKTIFFQQQGSTFPAVLGG